MSCSSTNRPSRQLSAHRRTQFRMPSARSRCSAEATVRTQTRPWRQWRRRTGGWVEAAAAEATARLNKRRVVGQRKGQPPRSTVRVACRRGVRVIQRPPTYPQDPTHRPDWTPLTRLAVVPWTLLTQANSQTNSLQIACVSRVQVDTTATDTVRLQRHGDSSSAHTSARH